MGFNVNSRTSHFGVVKYLLLIEPILIKTAISNFISGFKKKVSEFKNHNLCDNIKLNLTFIFELFLNYYFDNNKNNKQT